MSRSAEPFGDASAPAGAADLKDLGEFAGLLTTSAAQIDAHVGRRLRGRREALGVSQGRLGRQIGLTFSQVQKYEKGTNRIGAGRLYFLAALLGVPVQYFFEGLAAAPATRGATCGADGADASVLDDAIHSISDLGTRHALLSLVRSLSDAEGPSGTLR